MLVLLVIAAVADFGLAVMLVAVSGFIIEAALKPPIISRPRPHGRARSLRASLHP